MEKPVMHTVKVKMTGYKKTLKRVKKLNKEMKQLSKTAKELAELKEKQKWGETQ